MHGNQEYEISKYLVRKKVKEANKIEVIVDVYDITNNINLNEEDKRKTYQKIKTILGDFENFLLCCTISNQIPRLIQSFTNKEKVTKLIELFDLEYLNKHHYLAKEDVKKIEKTINTMEGSRLSLKERNSNLKKELKEKEPEKLKTIDYETSIKDLEENSSIWEDKRKYWEKKKCTLLEMLCHEDETEEYC